MSAKPKEDQLSRALDWAINNEEDDTLASAYFYICTALGSFDGDSVFESKLVNEKIKETELSSDPSENEKWISSVNSKLEPLSDHLFSARDDLCLAICRLLDM